MSEQYVNVKKVHAQIMDAFETALEVIETENAVDVVEVVRCKDCQHRITDEDYVCGHYCVKRPSNGGYFCEDDDFCSYGERREENAAV